MQLTKTFPVVFASDMHGNNKQYEKLLKHLQTKKPRALLLGGDLTPKRKRKQSLKEQLINQYNWVLTFFSSFLNKLKASQIPCYLILGNGDCFYSLVAFKELQERDLCKIIHLERVPLNEDFDIVGYPFVSFSYSSVKDFEKFDYSVCPLELKQLVDFKLSTCNVSGYWSDSEGKWKVADFGQKDEERDSIQNDLVAKVFVENPKRLILMSHGPAYNTCLDLTERSGHVGSIALREYIQRHQPYVCLSGHIHETVEQSGRFLETIGKTICMSSGNSPYYQNPFIIELDLYCPENAKRTKLSDEKKVRK
eukprot:TRINITY_DN8850_c0_g1_i1.p1 TRINITY_DN8850_c0_g1~~TRINITY_DN8850_c0_g1_i1.p1  ORF type:complete len:308 (-),score=48.31 TRINITY_DN8850_c0_g1_i1:87-1010(-)